MVMIMKLKSFHMIKQKEKDKMNSYHYEPHKSHANIMQQYFKTEQVNIPSIKEIIVERIAIHKWFNVEMNGFISNADDKRFMDEYKPLCEYLGIDYDSIQEIDEKHWFDGLHTD